MDARAVVDGLVCREGCALQFHTYQGKQFDGNLFHALCKLLEITKTRTTPYRPASNGQVERYNRVILAMIRCYLEGNQKNWYQDLQLLAGAIRATKNRQTGYTPNMLMHGREVSLPLDVMLGVAGENLVSREPHEYVKHLCETLPKLHELAREKLQSSQVRQKKNYDVNLAERSYEVGDLVYLIDSATPVGTSRKLRSPWKGLYLVVKVLTPVLFRIRRAKRDKVIHHDRLKVCQDREVPLWIRRARHRLLSTTGDQENLEPDDDPDPEPETLDEGSDEEEEEESHRFVGPGVDPIQSVKPAQTALARQSRRGRAIQLPRHLRQDFFLD